MNDQAGVGTYTFAAQPQQSLRDILNKRLVVEVSRQTLMGCVQADIFFQASGNLREIERARYADALQHALHELSVYLAQWLR